MDKEVLVYADIGGRQILTGRLWVRMRQERASATFEYDAAWLSNDESFALEPGLRLGPGPFHTVGKPLFGAIGDSAPDRWGRVLMRRAARRRSDRQGETARTLTEADYLLMVDDEARQGALRFAEKQGGPFLSEPGVNRIPPLVELPRLLSAAGRVQTENDSDDDLRLLLAPGSSLGGARPKASIRDRDQSLAMAKFPSASDEVNTVLWEAVALTLAAKAGISVPVWRLEMVLNRHVILLKRFDRSGAMRIPFISALSMLDAKDNEQRSYLEMVDVLRQYGSNARQDIQSLWRRIVFSILISNTDDHLRNHGFLHDGAAGWRLSPAYDLNPVPVDIKPRILSTAINLDDATASLDLALAVAGYFELTQSQASVIAAEVGRAVDSWRRVAKKLGVAGPEIERMDSAFNHADLKAALGL